MEAGRPDNNTHGVNVSDTAVFPARAEDRPAPRLTPNLYGEVTLSRQDVSYALTGIDAVIEARKWNLLELRALNELKALIAGVKS